MELGDERERERKKKRKAQTFLVLCPLISSNVYSFVSAIVKVVGDVENVGDVGDVEGAVGVDRKVEVLGMESKF